MSVAVKHIILKSLIAKRSPNSTDTDMEILKAILESFSYWTQMQTTF